MSFWPFINALSNSLLQKYLDSVTDYLTVTVDDLLEDIELLEDVLNELNHIKDNCNQNFTSFQFTHNISNDNNQLLSAKSVDSISLTSSNTDNVNTSCKDDHGVKLLELLIQPHILSGLLDYLIDSVDFYHDKKLKDEDRLTILIKESPDKTLAGKDRNVGNHQDNIEDDALKAKADLENVMDIETDEQQLKFNKNLAEVIDDEDEIESDDQILTRKIESASSILQCDIWIILNRIIETPLIMSKLWSLLSLANLDESSPAVAHFINIMGQLMATNSIELLNFVRRQPDLVDTFLAKIDIPPIMDFFLQIIQTDKTDSPTGILDILSQQDLILKLMNLLKPDISQFKPGEIFPNHELFFKQTAATDFIKALVTISANTALAVSLETNIGPNNLTRELVSPRIIKIMIEEIMLYKVSKTSGSLEHLNKHGINNCVGIIIELIRKNNSDYDLNCGSYTSMLQNGDSGGEVNSYVMFQWLKDFEENPPGNRDPIYLGDMLELFSDNLEKFATFIKLPTNPEEEKSLGFIRFKLSELIAELLHCSNMILLNSKMIRKIIKIRDQVRTQQVKRLKKALNESISFSDRSDLPIEDVTSGLDDVSLDDLAQNTESPSSKCYRKLIAAIETENDSDEEEPSISPENPFVGVERDIIIRSNPCVGDYFKINLLDLNILLSIVSLFTKFPWHNFFHNVVFDLIQQIFNGKLNSYNSFLIVDLFKRDRCNLVDLIVTLYKSNAEPRPGYMGHLILISEEVVKFTSLYKPDLISPIILDVIQSEDWEWFVKEVLLKTRQVYNVVLGADQGSEEEGEYGYDTSTVGYLDLDNYENANSHGKNVIILGDSSNHDVFVSDKENLDEDDNHNEEGVCDVEVKNMTPDLMDAIDCFENDKVHFDDAHADKELADSLSGSSSSDEDENNFGDSEDNDHALRRVPKHNS
jgi:SIT4-associating protein SAP155